jgi:hypothetical protein
MGRSASNWPSAMCRCSLRCQRARSQRSASASMTSRSTWRPGRCAAPPGRPSQVSTSKTGFRGANFSRKVCGACPLKDRCCPGRARRQINLGEHEDLLLGARHALADPATAEHLRRGRPRIERLLGLLAHRYGARKSRYIGSAKARLPAAWAALVNLNPIGHRLALHSARKASSTSQPDHSTHPTLPKHNPPAAGRHPTRRPTSSGVF